MVVNRYMTDTVGLPQSNVNHEAEFRRVRQDGRFNGFILYESDGFGGWDEQGNWSVRTDQVRGVRRAFAETSR